MVKYLNPTDVKVTDAITVVDLRETHELQRTGTVEGALHIPLGQLSQRLAEIPKEKPVYAYCAAGGRAGNACDILEANGYTAYNTGGIADWFHSGHKIIDI